MARGVEKDLRKRSLLERRDLLGTGALLGASLALRPSATKSAIARRATKASDFGALPGRPPKENQRALAKAIASVPIGGTLLIPNAGDDVLEVEASADLGSALAVPHAMTIEIAGKVKAVAPGASQGASQGPMRLMRIVGDRVSIVGNGSLAGPGESDDANEGGDETFPSLIYVTGSHFRFLGPTICDVPKIGIHLWNCDRAEISATWCGGIAQYHQGRAALFGIRATGGGRHRIVGNRFGRDGAGRRLITAYFAGGTMGVTNGDVIENNYADVHEKLAYLHSDHSRVSNNFVCDADQTDIVRVIGSGNTIESLKGARIKGGVAIYDGTGNVIRNCELLDVQQAGIFLSSERGAAPPSRTHITGNVIAAAPTARHLQDGIYLYLGRGGAPDCTIIGNSIRAPGPNLWRSGIRVAAVPPNFAGPLKIANNRIDGAIDGISLRRVRGDDPSGNTFIRLSRSAVLRISS